jgi:pimeloyl-CoA synthetase
MVNSKMRYSAIFHQGEEFSYGNGQVELNGEGAREKLRGLVSSLRRRGVVSEVCLISDQERVVARYVDAQQATLRDLPDGSWELGEKGVRVQRYEDGGKEFHKWRLRGKFEIC